MIPGDGPIHNHIFFWLEWCQDFENIQSYIPMETLKDEPQHHHINGMVIKFPRDSLNLRTYFGRRGHGF